MTTYLIRIFDKNIRTNYIERLIEAEDRVDALEKMKNDKDVFREAKGKLSTTDSISRIVDQGIYELLEL